MTSPLDALGLAFPCPLCGEMTDDPILYWRHKDHPKGKCTETYTGPPEEVAILKQLAEAARGKCAGTIPDTFIACGEADNYCSETCHLRAKLVAAEVKLRQERLAHNERCEFWMKRVAVAEVRVAELEAKEKAR